ncbi:MAG: hypothetical protein ACKVRN_15605 [Pyrinomonadaceae bacterium]
MGRIGSSPQLPNHPTAFDFRMPLRHRRIVPCTLDMLPAKSLLPVLTTEGIQPSKNTETVVVVTV